MDSKLAVDSKMFANPGDLIDSSTKITVDVDPSSESFGRIYGIVAPRRTCLLGGPNEGDVRRCWTIDDLEADDPDLEFVHQGDALVVNPDGSLGTIKVAVLSGDLEHSTADIDAWEAVNYLENTGTQIARVRYHWHPEGLVLSGVVYPSVMESSETLAKVMASPVSMEARLFTFSRYIASDGKYRLTGAILVNQPGFPLRRAASADIGVKQLVLNAGSVFVDASVDDADVDEPEGGCVGCGEERQVEAGAAQVDVAALKGEIEALRAELESHAKAIADLLGASGT